MVSDNVISYLAGFFDGEGSIYFSVTDKKYNCGGYRLKVCNTRMEPLELFAKSFNVTIYEEDRSSKGTKNIFTCSTGDQSKVLSILIDLYPYLVIKAKKTREVFEYYNFDDVPYSKYDDESLEELDLPYPYIAGFFDAEGCVTVLKNKRNRSLAPKICVVQKDESVCRLLEGMFGGFVTEERNGVFRWITCSPRVISYFYDSVGYFLLLKKERLEILLDMCSIKLNRWDSSRFEEKLELVDKIYILNH